MVDGFHGLGHDAVVGGNHQNGNVGGLCAAGTHGGEGRVTGGIQEGDHLAVYIDSICANVLGDTTGLARSHRGFADGVQRGGLAVVDMAHDHNHRGPGLQLLGGIHMVVNDLFLNGDGDFLFHLAAHFGGDKLGGVEVDGLVDTGHNAVLHQALDDLAGGLLHPGSQFANGDFIGNLHGDGRLAGHLHLKAAHLFLLLVAALVAPEVTLLLLVWLLALAAADTLLTALIVLNPLGDQIIHVGKAVGVDLHGGGIHHPALPLAFRLLGLFRLGGRLLLGSGGGLGLWRILRTGIILGLGLLGCRFRVLVGFGLILCLGFRLGSGGLHREDLLHGADLMGLGHVVEYHIQLLVRHDLGIGLGLLAELSDNLRNLLGSNAEICGDLLHTILHKTHSIKAPP